MTGVTLNEYQYFSQKAFSDAEIRQMMVAVIADILGGELGNGPALTEALDTLMGINQNTFLLPEEIEASIERDNVIYDRLMGESW